MGGPWRSAKLHQVGVLLPPPVMFCSQAQPCSILLHLLTCCYEGWAMEVAAMAESTGENSPGGAKGPLVLLNLNLGSTCAAFGSNSGNGQGVFNSLGWDQAAPCYKAAWEHSPLPRGEGELGNIHYKTFKSSLIYDHFAPHELGTSQALCSHQGSVSAALLGEHCSSGCQVLTGIAVHGAITDSSENLHFL